MKLSQSHSSGRLSRTPTCRLPNPGGCCTTPPSGGWRQISLASGLAHTDFDSSREKSERHLVPLSVACVKRWYGNRSVSSPIRAERPPGDRNIRRRLHVPNDALERNTMASPGWSGPSGRRFDGVKRYARRRLLGPAATLASSPGRRYQPYPSARHWINANFCSASVCRTSKGLYPPLP